jgi:ankyrin repeat protein
VAGSVDAVQRLLAAGADPDAALTDSPLRRQYTAGSGKLRAGATPLMRAAVVADVTMMRLLLEAGANANIASANGNTALLLAVAAANGDPGAPDYVPVERSAEAVRLVLSFGSDIAAVDSSGRTALEVALEAVPQNDDTVAILRRLSGVD